MVQQTEELLVPFPSSEQFTQGEPQHIRLSMFKLAGTMMASHSVLMMGGDVPENSLSVRITRDNLCGQASIARDNLQEVMAVFSALGVSQGSCRAAGYTVGHGGVMVNLPVVGDAIMVLYTEPAVTPSAPLQGRH